MTGVCTQIKSLNGPRRVSRGGQIWPRPRRERRGKKERGGRAGYVFALVAPNFIRDSAAGEAELSDQIERLGRHCRSIAALAIGTRNAPVAPSTVPSAMASKCPQNKYA